MRVIDKTEELAVWLLHRCDYDIVAGFGDWFVDSAAVAQEIIDRRLHVGRTRLADDSTAPPRYPHSPITQRAKRIPGSFLFQQYNEKGRRILPLRPRSGACCH